ncbi:MAG: hypothetical protein JEZ00_09735 [Anaerolineaceae bacterium]|nr:hypothetical protein [Anaerolineaceae bacterium]
MRGETRQAYELIDECLKRSKVSGYTWLTELAHFSAGMLSMQSGTFEAAAFNFRESVQLLQSHKEMWRALILLESIAAHATMRHQALSAARLFGAAEALRSQSNVRRMPIYQHEYELSVATLKGQMDEDAFTETWKTGKELTLDQALAYAVRCLDE